VAAALRWLLRSGGGAVAAPTQSGAAAAGHVAAIIAFALDSTRPTAGHIAAAVTFALGFFRPIHRRWVFGDAPYSVAGHVLIRTLQQGVLVVSQCIYGLPEILANAFI
jgi:hypothetical protein